MAEEEIKKLAFTDILTGLNNLNYLKEKFNEAINNTVGNISIFFIKINKIKEPCEILGPSFEKKLLTKIYKRIEDIINDNDTVILFSKYEFLLQVTNSDCKETLKELSEKISHGISKFFLIDDYEISLTSIIGISDFPLDSSNLEQLISYARMSITDKDHSIDSCVNFYSNEMELQVNKQFQLQNELSKAIYNKELSLAYQPIIDTFSKKIIKPEALLRWKNSHFGQVPPSTFIPVAEKSNLILTIGEWVLRKSCLQIRDWVVSGEPAITISINISARQLEQKDFIKLVKTVLLQTEVNPKYLEFEITESMAINDAENTLKKLKAINDMGISISMDDFGTRYSSLAQLKKLPVSTLKIDRSFINDLNVKMDNNSLVSAILSMAKSLDLNVIAEGVETLDQFEYLRNKNCDMIQGYLISRPVDIENFTNLRKNTLKIHKKNQI